MTRDARHTVLAMLLPTLAMLTACEHNDDPTEGEQGKAVPLNIMIPANDIDGTRAAGDPGLYERFSLPAYLYLWLVTTHTSGNEEVLAREIDLSEGWTKETLSVATSTYPQTVGDAIYRYNGTFELQLPENRAKGELYVAVSRVALNITATPTSKSEVEDITFDLPEPESGDSYSAMVRDIYSSPYNLKRNGNPSSVYYGTVEDYASVLSHIDLLLYHVGAKLDLVWNVEPADQPTLRLVDDITVGELKKKKCYLFRPMENTTLDKTDDGDVYSETFAIDPGNQWYGRGYVYTLPYTNGSGTTAFYPVKVTMSQQRSGTTTTRSETLNITVDKSQEHVFAPWIRGDITVK